VPPPKSLFGKHNERGLPIGNLTSQFWGNVYFNPLDHFVKRTLQCRYYLRYVDDMVLLAPERDTLEQWCAAIVAFLRERLHLALRPEMTTPFPVRQGIDFVGWQTWWNRRLPRRRILGSLRTRLEAFERAAVRPNAGDDCLLFFPCGRFIEFYGPQRHVAAPVLGLHSVALPRASYAFTAGFPGWLAGLYLSRAVRQGLSVVLVRQGPALLRQGCPPRVPWAVWLPRRRGRSPELGR
jgi:hypothetical protein